MKSEVPHLPFDVYGKRNMSHLLINSGSNWSIFNKLFYGQTSHIDKPNTTRKIENLSHPYHNYLKIYHNYFENLSHPYHNYLKSAVLYTLPGKI